ncbi:hypothetical protein M378DRAFT_814928 [Amanita muscaria Koide BX008]|uniref:FHA domain-containing protein n=1 Tax=Amanita muscaria (strain Koide BX008) TaxID=946122 RepID=A0A0C2WE91_AMAMK|nr:hypothetical protein M378DRAFT_814928 [Amanita muscaria Koide BX008]
MELQLGRDVPLTGMNTPKVRLKEMKVSKLHATVFWDAQRLEWSFVDMGSTHGTFLKSGDECHHSLRLQPKDYDTLILQVVRTRTLIKLQCDRVVQWWWKHRTMEIQDEANWTGSLRARGPPRTLCHLAHS